MFAHFPLSYRKAHSKFEVAMYNKDDLANSEEKSAYVLHGWDTGKTFRQINQLKSAIMKHSNDTLSQMHADLHAEIILFFIYTLRTLKIVISSV